MIFNHKELHTRKAEMMDVLFTNYQALWEYQQKVREESWYCFNTRTFSSQVSGFNEFTLISTFIKYEGSE